MTTVTTDLPLGRAVPGQRAAWWSWPLVLAATAPAICAVVLAVEIGVLGRGPDDLTWLVAWLVYVAVGAIVVRRRPELPVGRVLVVVGSLAQLVSLLDVLCLVLERHGSALAPTAALVSGLVFVPVFPLAGAVVLLMLPSGRVTGRAGAPLRRAVFVLMGMAALGYLLTPGRLDTEPLPNPTGLAGAPWLGPALMAMGWIGLAGCAVAALVRLVSGWRRSRGGDRRALAYLAVGGILQLAQFGVGLTVSALGVSGGPPVLLAVLRILLIATLPACVGLAVLRARLLDIELVLRRTLTYLLMTAAVVAVYVVTVLVVGDATSHRGQLGTSLLLTGLAAVALSPLRERAQRQVDRLLYGRRGDPYGVLRDLDAAVAQAQTPAAVLGSITSTIAQSLKLPYVAVEQDGVVTGHGEPSPVARELALQHHGRRVGTLRLAPRSPGEDFSTADDRLLAEVADHVASAVAAAALAGEAQQSRERLVHALEDDRRRIRRDLHDHLGPVLSGITLQLDALRRIAAEDDQVRELAGTIRAEVADAVVDVRRLVHDLRPPVLDELGLAEAIRQYADRLAPSLAVDLVLPPLPPLPAAVEVAAYRIVGEALTNTLRHADASRARVVLSVEDHQLRLVVTDDGRGVSAGAPAGVGLASMRERVAELGGRISVRPAHPGTVVDVELPR